MLNTIQGELQVWKKATFGSFSFALQRLKKRIKEIQRSSAYQRSLFLNTLELDLQREYALKKCNMKSSKSNGQEFSGSKRGIKIQIFFTELQRQTSKGTTSTVYSRSTRHQSRIHSCLRIFLLKFTPAKHL